MKISEITHFHLFFGLGGGAAGFQDARPEIPGPTRADKVRARKALNHAVAAGKITPQPCEKCGATKAQAHHEDYSKPLQVRWWCPKCHSQHHNQKHPLTKACVICGKSFTPHPTKRERAKTCSPACFSRREHEAHSRLTVDQMRVIRLRYAAGGITQQALADEFGCDRTRIGQIVRGQASRLAEVNAAVGGASS